MLPRIRLSEIKKIFTAHHIGNIILSTLFFVTKLVPGVCNFVFGIEGKCGLDRREHEILVFLGILIIWKNRKAVNWLHYLSNVFLYAKVANVFLFLRAEPLIGTLYVIVLIVHVVLFPEPAYKGPEVVTYFHGTELHDEIERNKRTVWLVQFYTTWSAECKHVTPVFAALSERFHLPNLRFAKLDIGRYPKEAERFRINIHPASKQLPTISLFKDGKEVMRRPTIRDKRAIPFLFTEENCILEYDLNNLHQECKLNMSKHERQQMKDKEKEETDKKTN